MQQPFFQSFICWYYFFMNLKTYHFEPESFGSTRHMAQSCYMFLASKPLCTHKILLSARQWTMIAARFGWKKVLKILCFRLDTLLKMIHFTSDIWTFLMWFYTMPVSYFTVTHLNSYLAQAFQCWCFGHPSESLQFK